MRSSTDSSPIKRPLDLLPGDLLDLQNDPYADPIGDNPSFEFELQEVDSITLETIDTVEVRFVDGGPVGFPVNHFLKVVSRLPEAELLD